MPSSAEFWKYFDEEVAPHLMQRTDGFRQIFAYLDQFARPVGIVETGCVRKDSDWGDGRSTVLFAKYAEHHPGSAVYSVDLDAAAVDLCRSMAGECARVHCGDSVAFLKSLADRRPPDLPAIDLLYLDSYDVDFENPLPSAIHHLKELAAAAPGLSAETLIVVDDSPLSVLAIPQSGGEMRMWTQPRIGGKGKLIAEYANQVGARRILTGYQMGWIGLGRSSPLLTDQDLPPEPGGAIEEDARLEPTRSSEPPLRQGEVPARIFQTWKQKDVLPGNYAVWSRSFSELNPAFTHEIWDDDDNRHFVEENFPWFIETYEQYPAEIYRADAVRYFYLYDKGGIYADMDSECLRPLGELLALGDVVLGRMGSNLRFAHSIPNAVMISRARQEFWLLVIDLLQERATIPGRPEGLTGPVLLKQAVDLYRSGDAGEIAARIARQADKLAEAQRPVPGRTRIAVLNPRVLYPLDWTDPVHLLLRERIFRGELLQAEEKKMLFAQSYVVNYWSHSWE